MKFVFLIPSLVGGIPNDPASYEEICECPNHISGDVTVYRTAKKLIDQHKCFDLPCDAVYAALDDLHTPTMAEAIEQDSELELIEADLTSDGRIETGNVWDPLEAVRESTKWVVEKSTYVTIDDQRIEELADELIEAGIEPPNWDEGDLHYYADAESGGPLTAQYVFVLDTLNFCFWPTPDLEYEMLAKGLKAVLEADPHAFDPERLANVTGDDLRTWFSDFEPPQLEERVRKVQQLAYGLLEDDDGWAINLVKRTGSDVTKLVRQITALFPGFRDEDVYKGRQVFFYKRAQIMIGDLWAAYRFQEAGSDSPFGFRGLERLTMFADYRVPQLLRGLGVMVYNDELAQKVDNKVELTPGSEEEIEIRAAVVQAVERLRASLEERGESMLSIQLDWFLWQKGESQKDELEPHHRTLTVFY